MSRVHQHKPVKVTVSDLESGEVLNECVLQNDYALITAGNRYLKSMQIMGRTHMLAVAVEKPSPVPSSALPQVVSPSV
ncbi:hypothetical protein [Methylobacterium aquaticum]|uniref:Uncharacterized protein n=1 Tax=Methylobacterium aquaticum TaxID=270351 RepID=A0A0C6FXQ2_9HYPH|nr:hypothetical protein [Methylobacterium aquaticum]BAQ50364.1 hypothetical protein Maq22A_4p60020 [Methylobacterium aquaticum]